MSFGTARYLKRQKNTNIFFSSEMNFFYNLHVSLALHPQLTSPYPVENFLQSLKEIDVIKTIENLTTYSRKPGDYNGTIIFEIDIMKNSFWRNWKIAKMALMNPCMKFEIFFDQNHSFEALWKWQLGKIFITCPRVRQIQDLCKKKCKKGIF